MTLSDKPATTGGVAAIRSERFRALAVLLVAALLVGVGGWWWLQPSPVQRATLRLNQALAERSAGRFAEAAQSAAEAYRLDPGRDDARLLAAHCAQRSGDFSECLEHALGVSADDPSLYGGAQLLAAQVCHGQLLRLSQAERHYRAVLTLEPDNVDANRGLARLLGQTGRRSEAIEPVLRLVRAGAASDLLMLVARDSGVIDSRDMLRQALERNPDDPLPRLGLAWHASDSGETERAIRLLGEAVRLDGGLAAAHAMLGSQWFAAGDFDALTRWGETVPPAAEGFAETWIARGRLAEQLGRTGGAIRCYAEAVRRRPESRVANGRLAQLLARAGNQQLAAAFDAYLRQLQALTELQDRIFFASEPSGIDSLLELISRYEEVGRFWEASGWCRLAAEIERGSPRVRQAVTRIAGRLRGAPLQLVDLSVAPAGRIDPDDFPLPDFSAENFGDATEDGAAPVGRFRVRGVTAEVGLDFRYFNGSETGPPTRMYEFSGGGIAVLDYDLDGWPDACFTQGCRWPPNSDRGDHLDTVYRNLGGESFQQVPDALRERGVGFGQGVTSGDYNADGFPDLYVANAGGRNRLYRNNGDGTFADVTDAVGLSGRGWTTSCVMTDLNGDGISDLYDVNYVEGEDVFERVCRDDQGQPVICMPFDFDAQRDTLWLGGEDGRFRDETDTLLSPPPDGKGLGVVALDVQGEGRLSLLVANDTTPNHLYVPAPEPAGRQPARRLKDVATVAGVAFNDNGKAEGCMGVAVGDVDRNGWSDFVVTNFLAESNSVYLAQGPSLFADRTRATGMREPSLDVLGFGTQFLDLDLDGTLELFVANGHIGDFRHRGRPYRMPAQLFAFRGGRFEPMSAGQLGDYFEQRWLGRSAARLDWNRDGREDLLVGHLYDSSRLLTNTTENPGHYLAVRLVGVRSNRDGFGARVTVHAGGTGRTAQLTSGDGYQAKNESRLVFGLGEADSAVRLDVRWPSGETETFAVPGVDREILVVEGQGRVVAAGAEATP